MQCNPAERTGEQKAGDIWGVHRTSGKWKFQDVKKMMCAFVEKTERQVNFLIKKLCSINNANEPKVPGDQDCTCFGLRSLSLFISVHPQWKCLKQKPFHKIVFFVFVHNSSPFPTQVVNLITNYTHKHKHGSEEEP